MTKRLLIGFGLIIWAIFGFAQQDVYFKAPPQSSTNPAASGSTSTIPMRSGTMSPESFKANVNTVTQNRNNTVNNLANQKLKNNPEFAVKPSGVPVEQPKTGSPGTNGMMPAKPPKPVEPAEPAYTPPPQTYTGFTSPAPSSAPSQTQSPTQKPATGTGFGNIYH